MIDVSGLNKSFGDNVVLSDISFSLSKGKTLALIGQSGGGKSTLLRCLNFLEKPESGIIRVGDLVIDAAQKRDHHKVDALRKKTAMVFQNYNLFKNKTALDNIILPLITSRNYSKRKAETRAQEVLNIVGLTSRADYFPASLSGGQQQRVGIARALALEPDVILFDEPTSSLDPEMVDEILQVIKSLAARQITMIISTHEIDFMKEVADEVLFIHGGEIADHGVPEKLFSGNGSEQVSKFIRRYNVSR